MMPEPKDLLAVYDAENNVQALVVQQFLESAGVKAFVTEDISSAGYWLLGVVPKTHQPQVWINRDDTERATQLLVEFEQSRSVEEADRAADVPETIAVRCEDCGQEMTFAGDLAGTVQNCSHCGSYVDVGDPGWPDAEN